eukprot:g64873.t1
MYTLHQEDEHLEIARPVKTASALFLTFLAGFKASQALFLHSHDRAEGGSTSFVPKQGVEQIMVRGSPLPLLPAHALDANCFFSYGDQVVRDRTRFLNQGDGASVVDGRLYGAAQASSSWAHPTGNKDDIVKGLLICWPSHVFHSKLKELDTSRGFDPSEPYKSDVRRDLAWIVREDGSIHKALWFFQAAVMPDAVPGVVVSRISLDDAQDPSFRDSYSRLIHQLSSSKPGPSQDALRGLAMSSGEVSPDKEDGVLVLVAKEQDASHPGAGQGLLGTASLTFATVPTGKKAWIEDVVVFDTARGRGIGSCLIKALLSVARQIGCSNVDLTSNPKRIEAHALYRKLGFAARDTVVFRQTVNPSLTRSPPTESV